MGIKLSFIIIFIPLQNVEGCFEDRIDHTMTEPPMKPLLKLGKTCPIPDRKTTSLKNAKFITSCKFAKISFETLGSETILLPTGDLLEKKHEESFKWDGVHWRRSMYGTRNRWASLYYLENMQYYVGLMGVFSFHFNYGKNHFYVNYGNEQSGILYGEIWLGSQAFIAQSCGEDCAMWCDVDERRMWSAYF